MKQWSSILAFIGLVIGLGILIFSADRLFSQGNSEPAVFKHINELMQMTGSYRADLDSVTTDRVKTTIGKGQFIFKSPNLVRFELHTIDDESPLTTIVSDGSMTWRYIPRRKIAFWSALEASHDDAGPKLEKEANYYNPKTLVYVKRDKVDMENVYVFEVQPKERMTQQDPEHQQTAHIYISVIDGTVRKTVTYDQEGHETIAHTFSNVRKDQSVSKLDFDFFPPKGTQVLDVDDSNIMRAITGLAPTKD